MAVACTPAFLHEADAHLLRLDEPPAAEGEVVLGGEQGAGAPAVVGLRVQAVSSSCVRLALRFG